ncbi:hypothetical protein IKE97_03020 [Candidatus Saccharibacteria bacterium]|nr:hypothetical protein [Candidatus Saccharibacteria bacterium]
MKFTKLIKNIFLAIICVLGLSSILLSTPTFADDVCNSNAPASVKEAAGCKGNANALPKVITNILDAIIAVTGIVAVIFVLIGGINYMTSNGDATKLEKAKKTILYACIGLAICVLAFAIVNFVIDKIIYN